MSRHPVPAAAPGGPAAPDVLADISTTIAELLRLDRDTVAAESTLLGLGAQSLDFVELTFRLERAYRIRLGREYAIVSQRTVRDYVRAVADALGSAGGAEPQSPLTAPRTTAPSAPGRGEAEILDWIAHRLWWYLGTDRDAISVDDALADLGASSFDFVDLASSLQSAYGIELPPAYTAPNQHTIGDYVRAVADAMSALPSGESTR